jgi:hypothetical protein
MNSRKFAIAVLVLIAPCLYGATTPAAPVVNEGTINYTSNQVTLTGSGFKPHSESPTVLFDGSQLNLVSASDAQIVAKLPASVVPGTFKVVVKTESGEKAGFDLTYGAVGTQGPGGPVGPAGPTGPAGPQGPNGTVLSYSVNGILPGTLKHETGVQGRFSAVILKNPGVYILSGQITLTNLDSSYSAYPNCEVFDASGEPQGGGHSPWMAMDISPGNTITIPVNGFWISSEPNTEIWLECANYSPSIGIQADGRGSFIAMQVQ